MSQVSKYPISKQVYERIFDVFLATVSGLYSKTTASGFLKEFLSPTEQIMLSKRLAIAFLLAKRYKHREITVLLRVSSNTINRVSLAYKQGKYYNKLITRIMNEEKMEDFWLGVGEVLSNVFSKGGSKSGSWRYLKVEIDRRKNKKAF